MRRLAFSIKLYVLKVQAEPFGPSLRLLYLLISLISFTPIGKIIKPSDAVQYVVAAGKDIFLWDVLYAEIYSQVKKAQVEKHAK